MYWICLSHDAVNVLLFLLNRERENDYHGEEEDGAFEEYIQYQKRVQELYAQLLFVVEHDK